MTQTIYMCKYEIASYVFLFARKLMSIMSKGLHKILLHGPDSKGIS